MYKNRLMLFLISFLMILFFVVASANDKYGDINIQVSGFKNDKGKARIVLFKKGQEKSFPSKHENGYKREIVSIKNKKVDFTFEGIPYGDYAISVHHDEDNNEKVNTNLIGMPKEGLGVSNDAKGNFGPPKFDDAKFTLKSSTITLKITMYNP